MPAGYLDPRPLGRSGIEVSALSLGSWRTYERFPAEAGIAILHAARDAGISFFDDARYNDETGRAPLATGYSEVVFGNLFRGAGLRRDEVVVANKLWWEFWPEQSAAAELEASLRRMGFDYVDLIYASEPPPNMSVTDLVGTVGGLIAAGKARAWGVLNWPAGTISQAAAAAALSVPPPCAAQLPYSLVRRSPVQDAEMTGALSEAGTGVVASFCLEGGVLSGKYRDRQAAGRAAGTLDQPRARPAIAAAAELAGLAERLETSPAALALAFPLASPAVASVLFGATSAEQVRGNCAAVSLLDRLSQADLDDLGRIGAAQLPEVAAGQHVDERHQRDDAEDGPRHLRAGRQVGAGRKVDPDEHDRERVDEADQNLD
jgi:L-glyceraldehyde 3-phosphate reductase